MYILVDNTPLSKVNRENGVHRQVLIAPWFYFADYVVNTLKLNNVYDPATNPTGIVHRALCALPDDFDNPKTLKARMDLRRAYNAATDIVELTMRLRLERLV